MSPVTATDCSPRLRERAAPPAQPATRTTTGRALVPVAQNAPRNASDPRPNLSPNRHTAGFLAQLIAADRNLPQARERRRAAPAEAIAAYTAAARL